MDVEELISLHFCNMLDARQSQELADWLKEDASHLKHFVYEASVQSSLYDLMSAKEIQRNLVEQHNNDRVGELLEALSEHERQAEPVEIVLPEKSPELLTGIRERKQQLRSPRHVSRLSLYSALTGWAALFLVIAYVMLNPRQVEYPTAKIVESVAARWSEPGFNGGVGTQLYNTDAPRFLREGLVKIRLNDGAEVLIQAPARFHVEDTNQLLLNFGKLSSEVPPSAHGFVVRTPSATVVDYGTEFGVLVDRQGYTEAHVFDGEVELRCGPDPVRHGGAQRLVSGLAGVVTADHQFGSVLRRAEESLFIRRASEVDHAMLAARRLDLSDVVSGGNGFGSGRPKVGIDLRTGKRRHRVDETIDHAQRPPHGFVETPDFSFVDSIFIPGFDGTSTQISSTGLTYDQFAASSGNSWGYLFNEAWHEQERRNQRSASTLDGRILDWVAVPAVSVCSNMGITFDLEQIRRSLPVSVPVRLRTRAGLPQAAMQHATDNRAAEFWVLVDGRVQLRQIRRASDGGFDIDIPLDASSRFVSLAVTEIENSEGFEWAVFMDPYLELEYLE